MSVTESEIQAITVAPRVTLADLEANISAENYLNLGNAIELCKQPALESAFLTTLCVVTLKNGFTVIGKSACASRENYNADIGNRLAREDAIRQIWPLMGYALREHLQNREEKAARLAHELNRQQRLVFNKGEPAPTWEQATEEERNSAIQGVKFFMTNPDATREQQHEAWMKSKEEAGWIYSPIRDNEARTHPCMLPFDQLPEHERLKDGIFQTAVRMTLGL